jgi:holo-[acyl-carrier protein] synthase
MRVIGHGVDIVEVGRIAAMLREHGERFLTRCFTSGERGYSESRKRAAEHLAGRFAAKEAVLKAIGTGWRSGIAWTDVEVHLLPSGQPELALHRAAANAATQLGITEWKLSISHTEQYAIASVIGSG